MALPQINEITISGNLTRDPETRHINGSYNCKFSIANNRSYKKDEEWMQETTFIDVECWNHTATKCKELLKGQGVLVKGRIKQDTWEDKDGNKKDRMKIMADKVWRLEAVSKRNDSGGPPPEQGSPSTPPPVESRPDDEPPF